jgi:hypothetical protein
VSSILKETITCLNPGRIAVKTSRTNIHADGLIHAMYGFLKENLAGSIASKEAADYPYLDMS